MSSGSAFKTKSELIKYGAIQFKGMEKLWKLVHAPEVEPFNRLRKSNLTKSLSPRVIRQIAAHCRRVASQRLSTTQINSIFADRRPYIRAALLFNDGCTDKIYVRLLRDRNERVAFFAASHEKIKLLKEENPASQLWRIDPDVVSVLVTNKLCPLFISNDAIRYLPPPNLKRVASRIKFSKELYDLLLLEDNHQVLTELLKNNRFPKEFASRLLVARSPVVRMALANRKDTDIKTLSLLSMDVNLRVRAVAANRLHQFLPIIRLTDWCAVNLGVKSSRVILLTQRTASNFSPAGWFVILSDFLRRVYSSNTGDYLDMMEQLNSKRVANNVSQASDAFQFCPFLEVAFRALSKEQVKTIMVGRHPKTINHWYRKNMFKHAYISTIRSELAKEIKRSNISRMTELLATTTRIIERRYHELNNLKAIQLRQPNPVLSLKALNLKGPLARYDISLPETMYDLVEAGKAMGNCLDEKLTAARYVSKRSGVILLKEKTNEKLAFVASVKADGKLLELKGRHNNIPPKEISRGLQSAIRKLIPTTEKTSKGPSNAFQGARALALEFGPRGRYYVRPDIEDEGD